MPFEAQLLAVVERRIIAAGVGIVGHGEKMELVPVVIGREPSSHAARVPVKEESGPEAAKFLETQRQFIHACAFVPLRAPTYACVSLLISCDCAGLQAPQTHDSPRLNPLTTSNKNTNNANQNS